MLCDHSTILLLFWKNSKPFGGRTTCYRRLVNYTLKIEFKKWKKNLAKKKWQKKTKNRSLYLIRRKLLYVVNKKKSYRYLIIFKTRDNDLRLHNFLL